MTTVRMALMGTALACLIGARPALAQVDTSSAQSLPAPAHVSIIDGAAQIERDGQAEPAVANVPLIDGDRLRTQSGRVEVVFPDGSILHVDQFTTVDLLARDLVRLVEGRIVLLVTGTDDPARAVRYQVDAPAASVQTNAPGEYRVALVGDGVELAVVSGAASFATDAGSIPVRAGERSVARPGEYPGSPQSFNSARSDAFDRWSSEQRDGRLGQVSSRYLPRELRYYSGTFDRYGSWANDDTYGNVWYPAAAADWRPYTDGYWGSYPGYGSVWIGADRWSWPTHHFGRWGISLTGRWFWIPARTWGPAWVYWAINQDYVGWCPLGWNDYPVYGMWGVRGAFNYSHHDPWRGWTVVPSHSFGRPLSMARVAIDGRRLDDRVRNSFVAQRTSPRQYAVPRSSIGARLDQRGPEAPRPGAQGLASVARGSSDRFRSGVAGRVQPDRARTPLSVQDGRSPREFGTERSMPAQPNRDIRRLTPGAPRQNVSPSERGTRFETPAPRSGYEAQSPRTRTEAPAPGSNYASPSPRTRYDAPAPRSGYEAQSPRTRTEAPAPGSNYASPSPRMRYDAPAPRSGYEAQSPRTRTEAPAPRSNYASPSPRTRYDAPAASPRLGESSSRAPASAPRPEVRRDTPNYSRESRSTGGFSVPRSSAPPRQSISPAPAPSPRYNSGGSAPRSASPSRGDSRPRGDARPQGNARPRGRG
jgi:hypothetical protein